MNFNFYQEPKWIIKDMRSSPPEKVDLDADDKYTAEATVQIWQTQPIELFKGMLAKMLKG